MEVETTAKRNQRLGAEPAKKSDRWVSPSVHCPLFAADPSFRNTVVRRELSTGRAHELASSVLHSRRESLGEEEEEDEDERRRHPVQGRRHLQEV